MSKTRRETDNARLKRYPDGTSQLVATVGPLGGRGGLHARSEGSGAADPERVAENRDRARRRARSAVRDLALCNQFDWFVTLTLDPAKIDRYDPVAVVRKASQWLSNAVRRRGLRYVLIPEHHKDGAIHFHGFMSGDLGAVNSGRTDRGGHEVFNLTAWPYGFSTAIRPYGDYHKAVAYCCKYLAKQDEKIGGRWYYSGGELERPTVEWLSVDTADLEDLGAFKFKPKGTNWPVWVLELARPEGQYQPPPDMRGFESLPDVGLHFEDCPPDGWEPGRVGSWEPDECRPWEQIRMEEMER